MHHLETLRELLGMVALVLGFLGGVLMLALVDVGLTVLLVKWAGTIRRARDLPQPDAPLPSLPDDHRVTVLGGGLR
jgi:hypothetical protein